MIIQTKRLVIRDYILDDLEDLNAILSDPETMSFWPRPFTRTETRDWIMKSIDLYDEAGYGRRAVILASTGQLIGDCGVISTTINEMEVEVEDIGWIISSWQWRQGYGTEAALAMRDYAFRRLNVDALYANMPWNHIASQRVAEKIGMRKVGEFYNSKNRDILTSLYTMQQL